MELTQKQREQLTLAIQGALGIAIITLSVKNAAKAESVHAQKLSRKNAKAIGKLRKQEYKMKTRLMKQKYSDKLARLKQKEKNRHRP